MKQTFNQKLNHMRKIFRLALFIFSAYLLGLIVSCSSKDKTAPVLVLIGGQDYYLPLNQKFIEPGYIATDNSDGDITKRVTISKDSIKINKVGIYTKVYTIKDKQSNVTQLTRNIHVYNESGSLGGGYIGTLDFPYPGATPVKYYDSISVSDNINNLITIKNFAGISGNSIEANVLWKALNGNEVIVNSQKTNFGTFVSLDNATNPDNISKVENGMLFIFYQQTTSGNPINGMFSLSPR